MSAQRCEQEVRARYMPAAVAVRQCARIARWKVTKPNRADVILCAQHKEMWMRMGLDGWEATPIGGSGE